MILNEAPSGLEFIVTGYVLSEMIEAHPDAKMVVPTSALTKVFFSISCNPLANY
jgi:hypothetical protein